MILYNSHVHRHYINRFSSVRTDRSKEIIGAMIDREIDSEIIVQELSLEYRENLLEQLEPSMRRMKKEDQPDFFFILCLVVKKNRRPDLPFNRREFKRLCKIHTKYCNGR